MSVDSLALGRMVTNAEKRVERAADALEAAERDRDSTLAHVNASGLSYRQIAHLTGTSHVVVGKRINRARKGTA